jgi:hypothetical protein
MERTTQVWFGVTLKADSQREAEAHVDAFLKGLRKQTARPDRDIGVVAVRLAVTPAGVRQVSPERPPDRHYSAILHGEITEVAEEFAPVGSVLEPGAWKAGIAALAHARGFLPSPILIRGLIGWLVGELMREPAAGWIGALAGA